MTISTATTNYRVMDVLCHDCSSGCGRAKSVAIANETHVSPQSAPWRACSNTRRLTVDVNGHGDQDCVDDGGGREQRLTFISTESNTQYETRCIPLAPSPAL